MKIVQCFAMHILNSGSGPCDHSITAVRRPPVTIFCHHIQPFLCPLSSGSTFSSDNLQRLLALGRRGQHLPAIVSDENIVLDPHAADGHVSLQYIAIDVLAVLRVREEETLQSILVEIAKICQWWVLEDIGNVVTYIPGSTVIAMPGCSPSFAPKLSCMSS